MRPSQDYGIVFESTLEARVAGQLLSDVDRTDLLENIAPPIPNPTIGRLNSLYN